MTVELRPLPTVDELRARWETEWSAVDAWLQTLTDGAVATLREGVPVWQLLAHVVNHGMQHRSEAAALLTAEGRSPGELDLFDFAEAQGGTRRVRATRGKHSRGAGSRGAGCTLSLTRSLSPVRSGGLHLRRQLRGQVPRSRVVGALGLPGRA